MNNLSKLLEICKSSVELAKLVAICFLVFQVMTAINSLNSIGSDVSNLTERVKSMAAAVTSEEFEARSEQVEGVAKDVSDKITDTKHRFIDKWKTNKDVE